MNRKTRHLQFSCNFDIFPGHTDTFSERLNKERVLLYKFNKSMDGLNVRFVVAVVNDQYSSVVDHQRSSVVNNQYSSVFVQYSRDNWNSENDIELTPSGTFATSTDRCFYDAVVPLSVLMPADYDSIQFRVGCSDGRLAKFDNNGGGMYEVKRLPFFDHDNNNILTNSG